MQAQDHGLQQALDHQNSRSSRAPRLKIARRSRSNFPVRNVHRTVGTMLSGEIARRYGSAGLPDDTIRIHLTGSAGQSLGRIFGEGRHADA